LISGEQTMLGIMGAMNEEVAALLSALSVPTTRTIARRKFMSGNLFGQPAVVVESRWGKVAAATTATHLIGTFKVDAIVFTGVAGAVDPSLRVGDIVVGRELFQHDMDASPLFQPMVIPQLGMAALPADEELTSWLLAAARRFVQTTFREDVAAGARDSFGIQTPRVVSGDVATGDRFFSSAGAIAELRARLPSAACVEMEGAAVAQVCFEHGVPFGIVRTISDNADHTAGIDFNRFVESVAGQYTLGLMRSFILG
jgi:adenosylhomocysteine nucleosidase